MYRYLLLLLWTKIKDYCHEFVGGKEVLPLSLSSNCTTPHKLKLVCKKE